MELDFESHRRALGERAPDRAAQHNSHRERDWVTGAAREARTPDHEKGRDFPSFVELHRLSQRSVAAVVQNADFSGGSAHSIDGAYPQPVVRGD